jgi:uncharacterized protein DUF3558
VRFGGRWVAVLVGLAFGAGCGSSASSRPAGPPQAAPEVDHPLDARPFLARPCDLLAPAQLASLRIRPRGGPGPGTGKPGTICTWIDDPTNDVLNAQWLVAYRDGLDDLYRNRGARAYFEETTVAGYPAVLTGVEDQRSAGECDLELAASAHDVLRVGFAVPLRPDADPCASAKTAAAAMIDTLKAAR